LGAAARAGHSLRLGRSLNKNHKSREQNLPAFVHFTFRSLFLHAKRNTLLKALVKRFNSGVISTPE
jgi:hypothetical protein